MTFQFNADLGILGPLGEETHGGIALYLFRGAMTLIELLAELTGAQIVLQREDEDQMMAVTVVATPAGRRVLAMERTYRQEIHVLLDPTEEEMETAKSGDLWSLWNSGRPQYLSSVI